MENIQKTFRIPLALHKRVEAFKAELAKSLGGQVSWQVTLSTIIEAGLCAIEGTDEHAEETDND